MSSQPDVGGLSLTAPGAPDAPARKQLAGFIQEACGVHVDSDEETDEHSDDPPIDRQPARALSAVGVSILCDFLNCSAHLPPYLPFSYNNSH